MPTPGLVFLCLEETQCDHFPIATSGSTATPAAASSVPSGSHWRKCRSSSPTHRRTSRCRPGRCTRCAGGKSVNTSASFMAALVHERWLRILKGEKRGLEVLDEAPFMVKLEKLTRNKSPSPKRPAAKPAAAKPQKPVGTSTASASATAKTSPATTTKKPAAKAPAKKATGMKRAEV
jgi:hypothetical protein